MEQGAQSQELDNEKSRTSELGRTGTNASTKSLAEQMSLVEEIMFVSLICLAQLCTQAGLGQVLAIVNGPLADAFGLSNPGDLAWLIAGYSLTVGTFILVAGRFGDLFGYKKMLLIGFSWFSFWSMVAGLAVYSNHVLFIFARVLQGIGPSICLPNGLALLGATYAPGPRKNMVFALFGATAPGGSIIGAVFAGLFSLAWWPWTFWSFSITLAIITVVGYFVIPDPPSKARIEGRNRTLRETILLLDPLGGLVGITALVLINFAWNQSDSGVVGWSDPGVAWYLYLTLILGILLVPVFFYIEVKVSSSPLIPFEALSADVAFVLGCIACGWGCFGIWVYYIWTFAEVLKGATPLQASAWTCPVAISGAMASISTGFLLGKMRPAMVMTIALTAFTVGTILIATAPVDQTYWAQFFVCVIVIPWGSMDMSFPAATLILSNSVAKEHQGIAASLVNTVVNYSISLALGFAGTVEANVNNGGLTPEDKLKGYRGAWYLGIGLGGMGLALSMTYLLKGYWQDHQASKSKIESSGEDC
ncbi:putative major facilitator superfamily transporter [Delphinella strobiligena]|nr:putative major facilitator superfamily transporter [Delphinella strobiligena]